MGEFAIYLGLWWISDMTLTHIRKLVTLIYRVKAAKEMNFCMHSRLIYASVNEFWDRVPMGRIINRINSDSEECDFNLGGKSNGF
jgi:hypothetical protein